MFIKTEAHIESMPSSRVIGGGGCLFALSLYSNMSFMQSFTETLCVWSTLVLSLQSAALLSSSIHFSTSRPVLLIIKPDYENTSESQNALTISNINKEIWQKGHRQHSANAGINNVLALFVYISPFCLQVCSTNCSQKGNQWGAFSMFCSIFHVTSK